MTKVEKAERRTIKKPGTIIVIPSEPPLIRSPAMHHDALCTHLFSELCLERLEHS